MRTPNTQFEQPGLPMAEASEHGLVYSSQLSYHEMADVPVKNTDVVEQLHANLKQLEDLQARLKFMMKEIRYLMKV